MINVDVDPFLAFSDLTYDLEATGIQDFCLDMGEGISKNIWIQFFDLEMHISSNLNNPVGDWG